MTTTHHYRHQHNNTQDILSINKEDNESHSGTTHPKSSSPSLPSRTTTLSSTLFQILFSLLFFVYNVIKSTMRLASTLFQSSLYSVRRHPTTTAAAAQAQLLLSGNETLVQNETTYPSQPENTEVNECSSLSSSPNNNKLRNVTKLCSLERSLTPSTVSTISTFNSSPSPSPRSICSSSSRMKNTSSIHDTVLISTSPLQIKQETITFDNDCESSISTSRSPSSSSSSSMGGGSPLSLHSPRKTNQKNDITQRLFSTEIDSTATTTTSSASSSSSSPKRLISFITDIEGDGMYFDRFVYNSKILDFESVTPTFHDENQNNDAAYNYHDDYFPYEKRVIFKTNSNLNNNNDYNNKINNNDSILVCGGDMWDKGGSDLYVTRQLLSLQKRYGRHRVQFILGNRDINKMRILQELGVDSKMNHSNSSSSSSNGDNNGRNAFVHDGNSDNESLPVHGGVYWLHGSGLTGDTELIAKGKDLLLQNNNNHNIPMEEENVNDDLIPEEYVKAMVPSASAADRLRWMLKGTMGSPDAFELRRNELIQEKKFKIQYEKRKQNQHHHQQQQQQNETDDTHKIHVSDEEVVQSYKSSTHPLGVMGQYLRNGHLALQIGKVMFLHGSLPFTPDIVTKYKEYEKKKIDDDRSNINDIWSEVFEYAMPFATAVAKDTKDEDVCNEKKKVRTTSEWIDARMD